MFLEIMSQFPGSVENTIRKLLAMRIMLLRGGENFADEIDWALLRQVRVFRLAFHNHNYANIQIGCRDIEQHCSSARGAANMGGDVSATLS